MDIWGIPAPLRTESDDLDLAFTLWALGGAAGLAVFAGWRGARPPDLKRGPRMIPWRPLMAASATAFIILLVHLVNLFGISTGQGRP